MSEATFNLQKAIDDFLKNHEYVYVKKRKYTRCSVHDEEIYSYTCEGCESDFCDSTTTVYWEKSRAKLLSLYEIKRIGKDILLTNPDAEVSK